MVVILAIIVDITCITTTCQSGPRRNDTETISDVSSRVREDAITSTQGHAPQGSFWIGNKFGVTVELQVLPAQTLKKEEKKRILVLYYLRTLYKTFY